MGTFATSIANQFQKTETPEAIWKDIRRVRQGYEEDIRDFIRRFEDLYRRLERLGNNQEPPDFMKRDQFIVALHEDIKEKVDDKEPESFEREKEVAITKWRKRMSKLGRDMREDDEAIEGVTPYVHKIHEKSPYVVSSRRESSTNGAMDLAQQVAKMVDEVSFVSTKLNLQDLCKFLNKRKILGGKIPMCNVIIVLNEGIFHQIVHILSEKEEVLPRFQEE